MNKIAIGNDHAGFELKVKLVEYLNSMGYDVEDYGCHSADRADYPDFAHPVARDVEGGKFELAVLICGSANGISMTANKHQGVRSAVCWNREIAELARLHNNANILALPARFISEEEAKACVDIFIKTRFEGGRHEDRVKKISC